MELVYKKIDLLPQLPNYTTETFGVLSSPFKNMLRKNGLCVITQLYLWSALKKIFNLSVPLLRAAGSIHKIILSALPRCVQGRCCEDQLHLTNFGTKEYAIEMGTSLAQIPTRLDDLAHGKRITEYEVLCVSSAIGLEDNPSKRELAKLWGSEFRPNTPNPRGLQKTGRESCGESVFPQAEAAKPWQEEGCGEEAGPQQERPHCQPVGQGRREGHRKAAVQWQRGTPGP